MEKKPIFRDMDTNEPITNEPIKYQKIAQNKIEIDIGLDTLETYLKLYIDQKLKEAEKYFDESMSSKFAHLEEEIKMHIDKSKIKKKRNNF